MLTKEELNIRNSQIIDLRSKGVTYRSIGNQYNLTRQRVKQIVDNATATPKPKKQTRAQLRLKTHERENSSIGFLISY
jgi:DNA-directed RNA polymerase sigma subunit (sigma70/sigma32)